MFEITFSNIIVAFDISLAVGLFIVLGNGLVIFSKAPDPCVLSLGLAFTGGAMVYVSLTEIFNKPSETFAQIYDKDKAFAVAMLAFLTGMGSVALTDRVMPNSRETFSPYGPAFQENKRRHIAHVGMTAMFAVTVHNSPEGSTMSFATLENPAVGMPLALAVATHNIPEDISTAVPVHFAVRNRKKTALTCLTSGLTEPLGMVLGYIMLKPFLSPFVFGAVSGVIAGVMVFLALDELLPAAKRYSDGHETVYDLILDMTVVVLSLVLFHS